MTKAVRSEMACPVHGARFEYCHTNGIRMRYAVMGSREQPSVLLLHGWPESWFSWRHQMQALHKNGFHVIAPDLRGYGSTDAPDPVVCYGLHSMLSDVLGLLDCVAINKQRVALIAHDWGAILGWAFAVLRPDRFPVISMLSVPPNGYSMGCWSEEPPIRGRRDKSFFYQVYHNECLPHNKYGDAWPFISTVTRGVAEEEYDSDPALFLRTMYFTGRSSSCRALKPWSKPTITDKSREAGGFMGRLPVATGFPAWCPEPEFNYYVHEFTRAGFRGGVNYYRNLDANHFATQAERLPKAVFAQGGKVRVQQPCLFIAGEHDVCVLWNDDGKEGVVREVESRCENLAGTFFVRDCGHWLMQEGATAVSSLLLSFLSKAVTRGGEFGSLDEQAAALDSETKIPPPGTQVDPDFNLPVGSQRSSL